MSEIKTKKHKQSKFLTIMMVPYSSQKTKSIKIPHWIFHVFAAVAAAIALALYLSQSQITYFKSLADSLGKNWSQSLEINSQLIEEKQEIENSVVRQKSKFEDQIESYEKQLGYYQEKARELEERIDELNNAKEDIYNLLSEKAGYEIARQMSAAPEGAADSISFMAYERENNYSVMLLSSEEPATARLLDTVYANLEERILNEMLEYDALFAEAQKIKPFLDSKPAIWPVWGIVTSEVGSRPNPFGSGTESHSGIDIAVPTGTGVQATGGGVVTYSGWMTGYGYLVIIDHGYGFQTYYGHNSKLLVGVGDRVSRGDVISKSGSTGRSTGPHVHYEVRLNGVIKNPRSYTS